MSLSNNPRVLSGAQPSFGVIGGTGKFADGTAAAPSITFASDPDTGFFRFGDNVVGFAAAGTAVLRFTNNGTHGRILHGTVANNIQFSDAGAIDVTAAGTNQNITLTPSGTGRIVGTTGSASDSLGAIHVTTSANQAFLALISGLAANQAAGQIVTLPIGKAASINNLGYMGYLFNSSGSTTNALTWGFYANDNLMRLLGTGSLLLGTTTDSGNGRIQLATHTTSAGGIGFGTETALYRSAAGVLQQETGGTTDVSYFLNRTGGTAATGGMYLPTGVNALRLRINGADALTLDSSQNATFAATIRESVDTRSGAGAISLTASTTKLTTTGADALTLADGANGQVKRIVMISDGGDGTLTPTTKTGFSTVTFNDVGDSITLQFYTTQGWMVVSNYGCTIA